MERTFWVLLGLGVCATSLTDIPIGYALEVLYLILGVRLILLGIGLRDRLEEVIEELEEEGEEGMYHEPYDIEDSGEDE